MDRVAGRTWIVWVIMLALIAGMVFFYLEYSMDAEDWVLSSGSKHVYEGNKLASGFITDRDGKLLLDLSGQGKYSLDETIRKATLHWVGDREGNISVPLLNEYASEMVGYNPMDGVYSYGDAAGCMTLTLDADVQCAALKAMGDYSGSVAVYNYKTGELLCAVTTPTFDPDHLPDIAGDITGQYDGAYVNRFIQSVYIPGSIFKIITLAAAQEGIPDISSRSFACGGSYKTDSGTITCGRAHGTQSLKDCFSNSCNCVFGQIALELGEEKLLRFIEQFGVVDPVSFDGFTTAAGNAELENVTSAELAWSGIGQSRDQVNLCAFLRFLGAIANDGVGVEPHVVSKIAVGTQVTYSAEAQQGSRIMSSGTAAVLKEYMNNNVEVKYGAENFPGLTVCAKTGTAEVGGAKASNAMFAGFLLDPEYPLAFIVAVEGGGYGSEAGIPVIQQVLAACTESMDS